MDGKEKALTIELEKILEEYELNRIHMDVLEKIVILVIASLGLVTALAWDAALTSLFRKMFGGLGSLPEEITYAVSVTIIAAVVSVLLGRSLKRKSKKNLERTLHKKLKSD